MEGNVYLYTCLSYEEKMHWNLMSTCMRVPRAMALDAS